MPQRFLQPIITATLLPEDRGFSAMRGSIRSIRYPRPISWRKYEPVAAVDIADDHAGTLLDLYKVLDVAHRFVQIFGHDQRQHAYATSVRAAAFLSRLLSSAAMFRALAVGVEPFRPRCGAAQNVWNGTCPNANGRRT